MSRKLLIVSDSPMWKQPEGVVVFEPTLREVELLTEVFDEITWIGFANPSARDGNARSDRTGKIKFHLLPLYGGPGIRNKVKQIFGLLLYVRVIAKYMKGVSYVHTRAPSTPAFLVILYSLVDRSRKYWHKFAGNWMQNNPPWIYAIQKKYMLRAVNSKVTVNGFWEHQPKHIYAFENPCFTKAELQRAFDIASNKDYRGKLNLLFAGRVEHAKGPGRIIEALQLLDHSDLEQLAQVTFVGKGQDQDEMQEMAKSLQIPYRFTGPLFRDKLEEEYAQAHLFLLPSNASEGFPKVIAESAAFGCLQCVSDVSSVTFYVHAGQNGMVFPDLQPQTIAAVLTTIIRDRNQLESIARQGVKMAEVYTYERYNERIVKEIFEITA